MGKSNEIVGFTHDLNKRGVMSSQSTEAVCDGELVAVANNSAQKMPRSIPYLVGNELAERFSYYGMKAILVIFMTQYLVNKDNVLDTMSVADARGWYHMFNSANYFFPILGSLVADIFWGKYKTILWLSVVYCLGHLCLALDDTRMGLTLGLTLIAMGAGGIKPVVSSNVGDQFTAKNENMLEKIFGIFYLAINVGAFLSVIITPLLLKNYGPSVAFGFPGILMLLATIVFRIGKKKSVIMPPVGWAQYKKDIFSPQGKKAIISLSVLYLFVSIFWALFDQGGSAWVLQAQQMNRVIDLRFWVFQYDWLHFEILAAQIKAANPILVLLLIPLFTGVIYPAVNKVYELRPMRKMAIGMCLAALSYVVAAIIEAHIRGGDQVNVAWQLVGYLLLTSGEIMLSVTGLEFSYTQAPNSMKSFIMGLWMLSMSVGNLFAAVVNFVIQRDDGSVILEGPSYFLFFAGLMMINTVLFALISRRYKEENYVQTHEGEDNLV